MPHKETPEATLQRVKNQVAKDNNYKGSFLSLSSDDKLVLYDLVVEAYRIERNKQCAPGDEEIDIQYPERNDSGTRLDINMGRREAAKAMRNHFTNLNK